MNYVVNKLSKFPALKIVLTYAIVSATYIYASDYVLKIFTSDVSLLSKLQTYKGLGFIFITSVLLYILVKRNIALISAYYQRIIDLKESTDRNLANSRLEYMSLFNNSPLPTWLFDPISLKFLLVNDAACENYGFSREEFLNMTLLDIRPAEEIPAMEKALSDSQKSETFSLPKVFKHKTKDGTIINVKLKICSIDFEGKRVKLVSVTDISTEMKIQERLIEMNARLQMASEIAGLGYWTNDLISEKIIWSDEVYKIFELNPDTFQLRLENIKQFFQAEDQSNFDYETYKNIIHQSIVEHERRIITGTGKTKWILERQHLTKDKNGVPVRIEGILLDITERKQNEQRIKEDLKALREIAWTQSHMVRAPLANLMGLISLMKNNKDTGISDEALLMYISDSAQKLDQVIRDIVRKTTKE
ncbi:MAG: PAS domain S-box protein [Bacteroidia bacterium]|nr:PAS domain S-box protein [Bacteroidia bacterium]